MKRLYIMGRSGLALVLALSLCPAPAYAEPSAADSGSVSSTGNTPPSSSVDQESASSQPGNGDAAAAVTGKDAADASANDTDVSADDAVASAGSDTTAADTSALKTQGAASDADSASSAAAASSAKAASKKAIPEIFDPSGYQIDRIWGTDAYKTNRETIARDVAQNGTPAGVIVCSAGHYIDSLSAAALSGLLNYPVLLVEGTVSSLNSAARESMNLMTGGGKLDVVILGGTAAIAKTVETELSSYDADGECVRLWGADGYDTNKKVYEYGAGINDGWNPDEVLVATGAGFYDALGSGSYAAANEAFILLANPASDNADLVELAENHTSATIVGGTAAVSSTLESRIKSAGLSTQRLAGADAFETNILTVRHALDAGMTLEGAGFSTGASYYDALGSSHLLGSSNAVMFLTSTDQSYNQAIYSMLTASASSIATGRIFGGMAAVDWICEQSLRSAAIVSDGQDMSQVLAATAATYASDLPDGTYIVRPSQNSQKAIDIAGEPKDDGTSVKLCDLTASDAQTWLVTHDEVGLVTLTNKASGKVLDASDAAAGKGGSVKQAASNESYAQKWIAVNVSGGVMFVSAFDASLVLDANGGAAANDKVVQISLSQGGSDQTWDFYEAGDLRENLDAKASQYANEIEDGEYIVSLLVAPRKTLDVSNGSTSAGANVWSCVSNMTKAQRWVVSHDDKGYITLVNSGSNMALSATSATLGANVEQNTPDSSYAQKWIAIPAETSGEYTLASAMFPDLLLDVANASTENCANVQLWNANGSPAQGVSFVSTDVSVDKCSDFGFDGWYTIASATNTSKVLDVAGGSTENCTNIQLYAANDTFAQIWRLRYVDGYYAIESAGSGKVLDVDGGNLVPHTNVQLYAYGKDNKNQLFSLHQNDDGTYSLISVSTGLALDVEGLARNGANIEANTYTQSASQCFSIQKKDYLLSEGYFKMSSALDLNAVLDVAGGSTSAGANVQIFSSNNTVAQKWKVARVEGETNTYTFECLVSGKLLAVDSNANVCVADADGSTSTHWTADIDCGLVTLKNAANGKVLGVASGSTVDGTNVQTFAANGTDAQKFKMGAVEIFEAGTYEVAVASNRSYMLDVADGSRANGANIQLCLSNDGGAQKWEIGSNGDGTWSFRNCRSKKYLDVLNANPISGNNVQQWAGNGSAAQRWYIDYAGNGSFVIKSALDPNLVLDIASGSVASGSNVQIYSSNASAAQRFVFSSTSYEPEAVILDVPCYNQYSAGLPNGCESAALTCVLRYFGFSLGDCTMADYWIPQSSWDFVYSFWGNPHSYSNGYLVCAPGITNAANNYLRAQGSALRAYDVSGESLYSLCDYLEEDCPVIIWTTVHQNYASGIYAWQDGYFACSNSHTVVLRGYDPNSDVVYLSDTIDGYTSWSRSYLAAVYASRGYQAVVIK